MSGWWWAVGRWARTDQDPTVVESLKQTILKRCVVSSPTPLLPSSIVAGGVVGSVIVALSYCGFGLLCCSSSARLSISGQVPIFSWRLSSKRCV